MNNSLSAIVELWTLIDTSYMINFSTSQFLLVNITTIVESMALSDISDDIPPGIIIYPIEGDKYRHSFNVHRALFGFIIGRNGDTVRSIQQDTKSRISIPRQGDEIEDIVITGSSRTDVLSARSRIDSVIKESRKKLKTHFLAIPMTDKGIAENYEKFKNVVLNETGKGSKGVKEEIFQKPEKMHLTLGGMLVLLDDNDVRAAIETLNDCKEKIIMPIIEKHGPIKIKAQGLGSFKEDLAKIRVLYGTVWTENDVLQELTDKMAECFIQKGLMRKEGENKLHLTLMNVSFAMDKKKSTGWQRVENIDATNIMKEHKDYLFGESEVKYVQICELGPKAEDGYYRITSKINLTD